MLRTVRKWLTRPYTLLADDSGQGMVEYGLLAALIAIAAIVVLSPLGTTIKNQFQHIKDCLENSSAC